MGEAKWNSYGIPLPETVPKEIQWQQVEEQFAKQYGSYATNSVDGMKSSQKCTVWAPMYSTKAGEAQLKELNDGYFNALKEYSESTIYTGFRMWKKNSKSDYQKSADA